MGWVRNKPGENSSLVSLIHVFGNELGFLLLLEMFVSEIYESVEVSPSLLLKKGLSFVPEPHPGARTVATALE